MIQDIIDTIDRALARWETTKSTHGLGIDIIEQGKAILEEGRNAGKA